LKTDKPIPRRLRAASTSAVWGKSAFFFFVKRFVCLGQKLSLKLLFPPPSPKDANVSRILATSHLHRHVLPSNTTKARTIAHECNFSIWFIVLSHLYSSVIPKGLY
jgi:hypothetical protein